MWREEEEHNSMFPARAQTRTAQCEGKHTNHEASTALLQYTVEVQISMFWCLKTFLGFCLVEIFNFSLLYHDVVH